MIYFLTLFVYEPSYDSSTTGNWYKTRRSLLRVAAGRVV